MPSNGLSLSIWDLSCISQSWGGVRSQRNIIWENRVFWDVLLNLNVYEVLLFLENEKNGDFHWDTRIRLGVIPSGNQPCKNSPTASLQ